MKEIKANDFFIKSTFKRYLFPSMIAVLGFTITNIIDCIIASLYIGNEGVATIGISSPIYLAFATIGSLVCVGAASRANICIGRSDEQGCNMYYTLAFVLCIVIGFVFSLLGFIFITHIIPVLGGSADIKDMIYDYTRIIIAGGVMVVLLYFPFNFLRVGGRPELGIYMFAILSASDLVLDIVFVQAFSMGIKGMALATVISSALATLVGLAFLKFNHTFLKFVQIKNGFKKVKDIVTIGSSTAINNLCNVFRILIINGLLTRYFDGAAIVVYTFCLSISNFALAIISGVSQTVNPLIGVFYAERDILSIKTTMKHAFRNGIVMISIFSIMLIVFVQPIGNIIAGQDSVILSIAKPALVMLAISLLFSMIATMFTYYYFSIEQVGIANVLTVSRGFVFAVLLSLLFSKLNSLNGIWLVFILTEVFSLVVLYIALKIKSMKKNELSVPYLLNQEWETSGKYIAFSVSNEMENAAYAAEQVTDFCEQQDFDMKTTMMVSLSIEEMLVMIFENCFKEGDKQFVDIRIFSLGDSVLLRMRNSGSVFDPIFYYEKKSSQSYDDFIQSDAVGIAMIVRNAIKVVFTRTFGVNNLTITLKLEHSNA